MRGKLIPNADGEFLTMALGFSTSLLKLADDVGVKREDAQALVEAVARFRAAYGEARLAARSAVLTQRKLDARADVERRLRPLVNLLRLSDISDELRVSLGLPKRATRSSHAKLSMEPPELTCVRALHKSAAWPVHELQFGTSHGRSRKGEGAVRLELFVALVPVDEPVPTTPMPVTEGRMWYLRSYTKSPIRLSPPVATVPMRVVYWGRWADSRGNVGPFSATAVGWVEGASHLHNVAMNVAGQPKHRFVEAGESHRAPTLENAGPIRVMILTRPDEPTTNLLETGEGTAEPARQLEMNPAA